MKICAYVQSQYNKRNYKNDCMEIRQFCGLRVIIDTLERAGYSVEWAGLATVHEYDIVLVSLTSDSDWWEFVKERIQWRQGNYKVIIGGAGCLHITPFLPHGDYFSLGRGEESVVNLVKKLDGKDGFEDDSIIEAKTFSPDKIYQIRQTDKVYPHKLPLIQNKFFEENAIGCNHKCLFCGYSWQHKFVSNNDFYKIGYGLFDTGDAERAILDIMKDPDSVDFGRLRSTALDGLSERLRYMVNKRISKECLEMFLRCMRDNTAKPHRVKFFNIVGYPTETEEDAFEFYETLKKIDLEPGKELYYTKWGIVLSCMHFTPTPATPMATAPVSKKNYRSYLHNLLSPSLKGIRIYDGLNFWCVDGIGTEHLATVMRRIVAMRGGENDIENVIKICRSKKFWSAPAGVQQATLEKYFDMDYLFGEFTAETLPSRYLRTYCKVEETWKRPAWHEEFMIRKK